MALLFSAVTVTAETADAEFLVFGIPESVEDLEDWTAFSDLLDRLDRETRFLANSGIESMEELWARMDQVQGEMDGLAEERQHVTNAMRRADPERKDELHEEKEYLTAQITVLREQLRLMQGIERRSFHMDETLTRVYESEQYWSIRQRVMEQANNENNTKMKKEREYER